MAVAFNKVSKLICLLGIIQLSTLSTAHAADASGNSGLLQQIANNTMNILTKVNTLPDALTALTKSALNWSKDDDSDSTATLQAGFTNWVTLNTTNQTAPDAYQKGFMQGYFGTSVTPASLPNANDLFYGALLGQSYFDPDPRTKDKNVPDTALNYIKNASAINVSHMLPVSGWRGTAEAQQNYIHYYNTISAVQSYNAYMMTRLYTNYKSGNELTKQQNDLLTQASSADWFSSIASQEMGIVVRQLLMFNSQIYVLLNQLLETQRQQLVAQSMTNSLLVLVNLTNENELIRKAANP